MTDTTAGSITAPRTKAKKKSRTIPGGFRKGDPVPEWLIGITPRWPWSVRGTATFDLDCILIARPDTFEIRAISAGGRAIIYIENWELGHISATGPRAVELHPGNGLVGSMPPPSPAQLAIRWLRKSLFGPFVRVAKP